MDWDPSDRSSSANYHFLVSAVMPRPIAWVTTMDDAGVVNAAPFSWTNTVCADPPMVMLAVARRENGSHKDTAANILATGEFVSHAVPEAAGEQMVATSAALPPGASEVKAGGLATIPSSRVKPPRLAAAPVSFECRLSDHRVLGRANQVDLVLGEIVHIHADDAVLDARGNVDPDKVAFLARMGGRAYTTSRPYFEMARPKG